MRKFEKFADLDLKISLAISGVFSDDVIEEFDITEKVFSLLSNRSCVLT